ncbi:predicted protein [Naegleria gruberi]|uniref:Predicted protein n=1 Tax=Naegleria gruberi TaxID=5762 RepID=D2UYR9_NAEGR|nr:uncharacterized protein NAEGRDRAFT_61566 [Naegleria gruberi]EFC50528.1 predicted protein [Naegleria gruberi]|eukprot:XP_002683272.1 predicted protein [Naegleria gruberi strain NEG-M]
MAPNITSKANNVVFIDATPSTPTKKTTKQRSTTPIKSPTKNTIMNFFSTKKQTPSLSITTQSTNNSCCLTVASHTATTTTPLPPTTNASTTTRNNDALSITSEEDDVIMIESSQESLIITNRLPQVVVMEMINDSHIVNNNNNTNNNMITSMMTGVNTTPKNDKKRKYELSPSTDEEKKENIDPKQMNAIPSSPIVSPKKKKLKETIVTASDSIANTTAATTATTPSSTTISDKTPTSVEECEELIQQLVNEVKNLKPSLDDSSKLRKDEKIKKYLKKLFEFCQSNKEFQANKNTYPFKPAFINLLIAYCQGVASLDVDELIQDVRKSWIKIAQKKQLVTGTIDENTIDNLLPTIDAMKNAINLHLERKVYGVKDLCEISVWEARKLSSLTTKVGSTARDCATLAKQMRSNFKKIAETKGKEINKLQKLKVKLEKQAAKETKKEAKKEAKKEVASNAATLTSPKKNKQTQVKCKSITLFTQKCNILKEDKVVSAPVCRVQSGKTIEEIDLAIAAQNYPVSLKETIASMKKNPLKKPKVAFKFISLFGKVHTFHKDEEECQSTVVNGRKPLAKDPNMTYPEEDEEEMEELVLGEADLAVEGECLDSEDDDGEELEFDSEDDVNMEEDNICADDIIEYEDGKIEHVETSEISKDQQKKKKRQQLSDLDPIFECSNQLQEVTFTVDEDFIFDISELNCNQVFWWQNQSAPKKNVTATETEAKNATSSTDATNSDKMDTTSDGTTTTETGEKKSKPKKQQGASVPGEIKFVNQTDSFTSPSKSDVWESGQMEHLKIILTTCATKPEIVAAMLQKFPSLSKNRVNKKIKDIVVKEKRDGDSKTKFYLKE